MSLEMSSTTTLPDPSFTWVKTFYQQKALPTKKQNLESDWGLN